MRKFPVITIFMGIIISSFAEMAHAQDLIITYDDAELNCQITRIRDGNVYFILDNRNRVLSLEDVEYYEFDYFSNTRGNTQTYFEDEALASKIRIALNGGWGYRTAKIGKNVPPEFVSYMKELRNGYSLGLNATYYFREKIGTGIKFNYFGSKNSSYTASYYGDDNISIYFIGPTFGTRQLNQNRRNGFIFNVGLGYLGYYDKGIVNSQRLIIKNGTLGVAWDVGYDIGLSDDFALGIQLSFISGYLTSLKVSDGRETRKVKLEKDDYENLSTLNLSVGLRFNLGKTR